MDTSDVKTLEPVDCDEAVELLETQQIGRLIFTRRALPAAAPVNYVMRQGAVWFWTASNASLGQALNHAVVGFEVDHLDPGTRTGWSVLVLGVAELITDAEQIELARAFGPEPWAPGRMEHLIRIPLDEVTGRRIYPWYPLADWGDQDDDVEAS